MTRLVLFSVFLLITVPVQAQVTDSTGDFRGMVWSDVNQKPLEDAVVVLKWSGHIAESDSLGRFRIPGIRPGRYQLQILGFGYDQVDTSVVVAPGEILRMDFTLSATCPFNAQEDINNEEPKLLLIGSIAPVIVRGQEHFERKYGVRYYDFGDIAPADACISKYNRTIFDYLDQHYGARWRNEVRDDVEFLSK